VATIVEEIWSIGDGDLVITMQYDDVTLDFDWIRAENTHPTNSYHALLKRGNGVAWRDVDLPPGFDQTFNSGGPVRNRNDIPEWHVGGI
jgi:hypothetical protein